MVSSSINKILGHYRQARTIVSFAVDTRIYACINDIEKCNQLQIDLNSVYDWAHVNNMF